MFFVTRPQFVLEPNNAFSATTKMNEIVAPVLPSAANHGHVIERESSHLLSGIRLVKEQLNTELLHLFAILKENSNIKF